MSANLAVRCAKGAACLALLSFMRLASAQDVTPAYVPPAPSPPAERVTLCQLFEHPEQYQGKEVQVYAQIAAPSMELTDLAGAGACPSTMRLRLEFPSAHTVDLMDIETRADVKVLRHAYHPLQVALVRGVFHAGYRRAGNQRVPVDGGDPQGYGPRHDFDGALMLQSLAEYTVVGAHR